MSVYSVWVSVKIVTIGVCCCKLEVFQARKEPVILLFTRVAKFYVVSSDVLSLLPGAKAGFSFLS